MSTGEVSTRRKRGPTRQEIVSWLRLNLSGSTAKGTLVDPRLPFRDLWRAGIVNLMAAMIGDIS